MQPKVDVIQKLESLGVNVVKSNSREILCYCPFHGDKTASNFFVNKITGLWKCFACGEKGNITQLINKLGGEKLKPVYNRTFFHSEISSTLYDKLKIANHKDSYFVERGINRSAIKFWGVKATGSGYIYPIKNKNSRIVGFAQRSFISGAPTYTNSTGLDRNKLLFGEFDFVEQDGYAIIVEGIADCIKMHSIGFRNTVATFGTNVSKGQVSRILKLSRNIRVLFDNDDAGKTATLDLCDVIPDNVSIPRYEMDHRKMTYVDYISKDPGDAVIGEIRKILKNMVPYRQLLKDRIMEIGE